MSPSARSNKGAFIEISDLKNLRFATDQLKSNLERLQMQWDDVKTVAARALPLSRILCPGDIVVNKKCLEKIAMEVDQAKTLLPRLVNQNLISAKARLSSLEAELERSKNENTGLEAKMSHWRTQAETAMTDVQKEKRSQLELRVDVQELTNQLSQQSEFCSSLGSTCCTLLWRVSRRDDSIQDIISGTKSPEFFDLMSTSVHSYLTAYKDDQWPNQQSDEAVFIIALCGTATNVAASAVGREHLASCPQGRQLIDTFVTFVGEAPITKSANMKSLMLMTLFNVSINQKGVKYLQSKSGLIDMLAWHLKEEQNFECRANTLRLLLSLVSEEGSGLRLLHELKENLSTSVLQQLTTDPQADIRDLALDLLMDMRRLDSEQ